MYQVRPSIFIPVISCESKQNDSPRKRRATRKNIQQDKMYRNANKRLAGKKETKKVYIFFWLYTD